MSEAVVAKFGGTSMAQPEVVASLVEQNPDISVIVPSAPGKVYADDIKTTDELLELGYAVVSGNYPDAEEIREKIINRFNKNFSALGNTVLARLTDELANDLSIRRYFIGTDFYAPVGEKASARYFGALIGAPVVDSLVIFKGNEVDREGTARNVQKAKEDGHFAAGERTVATAYYGYKQRGAIGRLFDMDPESPRRRITLGRGGSDRSGALYAAALNRPYHNYSDVDGIYSADPRVVPEANVIPELTRWEVREGANGGSGVLQGDTLVDLMGTDTVVTVKNTFNPASSGTRIIGNNRQIDFDRPIVSVTGQNVTAISVIDMGMADARGYLRRIFDAGDNIGLSFEYVPTAQDAATFTLKENIPEQKIVEFVRAIKKNTITGGEAEISVEEKAHVNIVGEALRMNSVRSRVSGSIKRLLPEYGLSPDAEISNPKMPSVAYLTAGANLKPSIQLIHQIFVK